MTDTDRVSAANPKIGGLATHLMCRPEDIGEYVLLPGDPGRVAFFADMLDDYRIVAKNREYVVATGSYNGLKMTVCSTGIGGPSTEIAVVELIEMGAKTLIRIGGCGVLRKDIELGSMVINTAAVRKGGASIFYAEPEYPCVASYEVVHSLVEACRDAKVSYHTGICASVGSFFAGQGRDAAGVRFHDEALIEAYKKRHVINMEMEAETIMTLASVFGINAGSITSVHGNRETDEWLTDFEPAQRQMCRIALEACLKMSRSH